MDFSWTDLLDDQGTIYRENPGASPKAGPIFKQPLSLAENAQTLAGIAVGAAGKSVKNFPAASKFVGKHFHQGISDSNSLLEFSDSSSGSKGLLDFQGRRSLANF